MKKRIHVNKHVIEQNKKNQENQPVLSCKTYKENIYGNDIKIFDKEGNICANIKYSPQKPLSCGAVVWIETDNEVEVT